MTFMIIMIKMKLKFIYQQAVKRLINSFITFKIKKTPDKVRHFYSTLELKTKEIHMKNIFIVHDFLHKQAGNPTTHRFSLYFVLLQ